MSTSPKTHGALDEVSIPLTTVPGSGDTQNTQSVIGAGLRAASCCYDRHHRKLAICSILCGISCIGIKALINSVQAERETDPESAVTYSKKAKKFGIISIVVWVSLLVLAPLLLGLISYLLTLRD